MQVKLIKFIAILTLLTGVLGSANVAAALAIAITKPEECQVKINSSSDFFGAWRLESTSPSIGNGNKRSNELWQFNTNGTFQLTAEDHRASATITSKTTFRVENDTLKIALIGRSNKFYVYQLCSKDDAKMVLFGGIEGFHFFSKK